MKTKFLSLALFAVTFMSCHKDDDNNNNNPGQVTDGTWHVSLFTDSGNNETSDFSGYSFTFKKDGTVIAVKGNTNKSGTWSSGSKFIIDLGAKSDSNKPLGELTDDWKIISITSTDIKLGDDNPSSGELLTFTKD